MYKLLLILKYLRRRRIAWVSLLAVMLCTTMVLVVISVMGGWLEMFENSARGLTGDVVIKGNSLSGFPYYQEIIDRIEADTDARVQAAVPSIFTFGVINVANMKTDGVHVVGLPLDQIGRVNAFPDSLYRQHQKYVDAGQAPPPGPPTWDLHTVTEVDLDSLPDDVPWDAATGRVMTGNDELTNRLTFRRGFPGGLRLTGKMTDDERATASGLSAAKEWRDAIRQLAVKSNWPGMIASAGVLDIRRNAAGAIEGRDEWKYTLWAKLTVVGVGTDQSFDEKNKAERQYWVVDDSRTGMWQYDTQNVYVPFDVLQRDLGMDARPITLYQTTFASDARRADRVMGVAPEAGTYSLYQGRGRGPAKQTVELKAGDALGFRFTPAADGGQTVAAVAGGQTFDLGPAPADADWRFHKPAVEPARTTEIHVRLKPGADLIASRNRIRALVADVMKAERAKQPRLVPDAEPRVETWKEASALFINAIEHEKLLVAFLFGIISLVAVFLIFCIFYMIVAEKTKDIGIIKSVGATGAGVAGIFLGYGLAIGIVGAGLGLLSSYMIVHNINDIHTWMGQILHVQIWNPEVYAFDRIPNTMNPKEVALITGIAVLASVVGSLVPAVRAAGMHPVEALRWE